MPRYAEHFLIQHIYYTKFLEAIFVLGLERFAYNQTGVYIKFHKKTKHFPQIKFV